MYQVNLIATFDVKRYCMGPRSSDLGWKWHKVKRCIAVIADSYEQAVLRLKLHHQDGQNILDSTEPPAVVAW